MFSRYDGLLRNKDEESNFWPSFTDLLSSILLFILVFMLVINAVKTNQINQQQEYLEGLQEQVKFVQGIGDKIGSSLLAEFEGSGLDIGIDSETGTVKFSGDIFFDTDKATLKKEFKDQLKEFIPKYLGILLSDENKQYISEIIVEGHTDDIDTYMYNLNLSQDRAYNVVRYILSNEFPDFQNKEQLLPIITANGRSWSELIYNEDGSVNKKASRRVEFKFRLKDIESLEKILGQEKFDL